MPVINAITLLLNGLTLALALSFMIIILWHDSKKVLSQFFALFLVFVVLWNTGSLLVQAGLVTGGNFDISILAVSIAELGFAGSSIAVYVLATILVGAHTYRFRILALLSVFAVLTYRLFLIVNTNNEITLRVSTNNDQFHVLTIGFYVLFDIATLYVIWRYRRRIRSKAMIVGIVTFVVGQSLSFANPELAIQALSTSVSSIGALIVGFAILHQEIIQPLNERNSQVESMHQVSLAITSQMAIDKTLSEIAIQAAGWLQADGVAVFLMQDHHLELVNVYQLPHELLHSYVEYGQGIAGTVAITQQSLYLENYARDWLGTDEFSAARERFGSVICVPLIYANAIIGVLTVISSKQGRLFKAQDVRLLELLGAQAAVAIAHGRLYAEERAIAEQLETLLVSTTNPVIAVNRGLQLIFSNPAAKHLFGNPQDNHTRVDRWLPASVFPPNINDVLRSVRSGNAYTYEMTFGDHIFLCHLAVLGRPRIAGWVAILNDVTELKELDRLKGEMVRMASHDLKNPLMGAMAYLELLMDELDETEQEDRQSEILANARQVERQLERMNRIIRGVLDLERLRFLTELRDLCDAGDIVKQAISELDIQLADEGVELKVNIQEGLPAFLGNQDQFTRAIVNLIENALKFSINGRKQIFIEVVEFEGRIRFSIQDNGVGIPSESQERIFDRFFRAEQPGVAHVTGSGLGLNLVKSIVDHHNGNIWLKSTVGVGTTFYVEVPIERNTSFV